ncbi:unnamed protein product, partial [Brachionus calyciflorus]
HSDSANLTQLNPVNFSYSGQTVHSQLYPDRQVNLNQIIVLSQSNNLIPQGAIRFGTFNTSFTTTGLNYSGQKISLNLDRTGLGFAEDLYNICVSYVEGELKANLLDIFVTDSIKNACSNEQIFKLCEIGFGQIRGENSKSLKRRRNDDHVSTSPNFTNNLIPGPSTADETVQDT